MSTAPPVSLPLPEPEPEPELELLLPESVKTGFVGSLELAVKGCDKSSEIGPELSCCKRVASTALLLGLVEPEAQMMVDLVFESESTGMVKTSFGFVPVNDDNASSFVAVRGGLGSTVGMTSALVCR